MVISLKQNVQALAHVSFLLYPLTGGNEDDTLGQFSTHTHDRDIETLADKAFSEYFKYYRHAILQKSFLYIT